MYKKFALLLLIGLLSVSLLIGCSTNNSNNEGDLNNEQQAISDIANNNDQDIDEQANNENILKESGTFEGLIDNNSIEIRIAGVQSEEHAYRAFMLSDSVKENFESYEINEGDQVLVSYIKNDNNQLVIVEIQKI